MTEQEKREKAIEEIAQFIKVVCPNKLPSCKDMECDKCLAECFYTEGYRKEDEVRKETANEIIDRLRKLLDNPWQAYDLVFDDLRNIGKEYGVEVEE